MECLLENLDGLDYPRVMKRKKRVYLILLSHCASEIGIGACWTGASDGKSFRGRGLVAVRQRRLEREVLGIQSCLLVQTWTEKTGQVGTKGVKGTGRWKRWLSSIVDGCLLGGKGRRCWY